MQFLIADSFTDSLAKLNGQEQKAVKTTAFDLQLDPAHPGMRFHRLNGAKDPNFWSVRVSRDLRLIVHRTPESLMLCYVDHHDPAYRWAERRRIERHPRTGAAQLVEVRETVEEITVPQFIEEPAAESGKTRALPDITDEELLGYGVPPDWMEDVKRADEDTLLELAEHLPHEAAEALLDLATGVAPEAAASVQEKADPFAHPDAQRRFRVMTDVAELERALDFPWEKWTVFLHPAQRRYVERDYNGPARISGSAGTGKTIVALHRAVFLARTRPKARVLLTTFSNTLANALRQKLERLAGNEPDVMARIAIHAITGAAYEMYAEAFGQPNLAPPSMVRSLLEEAAHDIETGRFSPRFLYSEWADVVDAWQLDAWEAYCDVPRLGRKTRIGGRQREVLWAIFEEVRRGLRARNFVTWPEIFGRLADQLAGKAERPFDHAVVDEAQDIGIAELRFLAALGAGRPDALFFTGDLGQRIFQQPFSWKALGVDIRGRSHTLRVNYRTSHQIRSRADRLLPASLSDVDGNEESRCGTVSVFNGPPAAVATFADADAEAAAVGAWIAERLESGLAPQEIGVFVRSAAELKRARAAVKASKAKAVELGDKVETAPGHVSVSPMHLAKGLEFRAVAVMACDDEVLPLQERIEGVADESDLEEVYTTERHLLYVACTRAREHLMVSGVRPASEFLEDLT